jgi:hypothetical protein
MLLEHRASVKLLLPSPRGKATGAPPPPWACGGHIGPIRARLPPAPPLLPGHPRLRPTPPPSVRPSDQSASSRSPSRRDHPDALELERRRRHVQTQNQWHTGGVAVPLQCEAPSPSGERGRAQRTTQLPETSRTSASYMTAPQLCFRLRPFHFLPSSAAHASPWRAVAAVQPKLPRPPPSPFGGPPASSRSPSRRVVSPQRNKGQLWLHCGYMRTIWLNLAHVLRASCRWMAPREAPPRAPKSAGTGPRQVVRPGSRPARRSTSADLSNAYGAQMQAPRWKGTQRRRHGPRP